MELALADFLDFGFEVDAELVEDAVLRGRDEFADVDGGSATAVDDEVAVFGREGDSADGKALETGDFEETAGVVAGWVGESGTGAGTGWLGQVPVVGMLGSQPYEFGGVGFRKTEDGFKDVEWAGTR